MVYFTVSVFTLISVVVVIALFDRQLGIRIINKTKNRVRRLSGLKISWLLRQLQVTSSRSFIKRIRDFVALNNLSRIPIISTLTVLVITATIGICYALINSHSLEVYHAKNTIPSTANSQINQLLVGERLRPPPSPPEELFAELDAEIASYQAMQIEKGYWLDTENNFPQAEGPLMLPEPDLSDLNAQDHSTGYSGDMLASHLHNGHINIKNADRNWKKMNSEFVQRLLTVYKVMSDQYGYDMVLLEGYRSPARQARLLKKGSHVTKAGSYKSYHQFGLAGDSAFIKNGKIVITEKDPWAMRGYKLYGKVAKSAGLVWGGDWRMMDLGHVELRKKGVLGRPEMAEILTRQ